MKILACTIEIHVNASSDCRRIKGLIDSLSEQVITLILQHCPPNAVTFTRVAIDLEFVTCESRSKLGEVSIY